MDIRCPQCDGQIEVSGGTRTATCPHCGRLVAVPAALQAEEPKPAPAREAHHPRSRARLIVGLLLAAGLVGGVVLASQAGQRARYSDSANTLMWIGALGAIACAAAGLWMIWPRREPSPAPPCPNCGRPRQEVEKSSRAVTPLFAVGLFLILLYGVGLLVILAAGVLEAATRKRWRICRFCDEAEPAPPRASEL